MKISKKILVCLLVVMMALVGTSNIVVEAAEMSNGNQIVMSTENIKNSTTLSQTVVDNQGNESVIEITEVPTKERAGTRTWKVSFTGGIVNCHFYMKVSNNKCIKAYNKKIITIACTYSNAKLTRKSKYARLSMDVTSYKNLVKFNGWLQGKVTGKNNDIKVTYSF